MNPINFQLEITNVIPEHFTLPEDTPETTLEWKDKQGEIGAYTYQALGFKWMQFPGLATFRITDHSDNVLVIQSENSSPQMIQDIFQRTVIPFILQARGKETLHASSCYFSDGVVGFCGDSGVGKSTIAYGLAQQGYPLWSDDSIVFETYHGHIYTIPLEFRIRLLRDAREFFYHAPVQTSPINSNEAISTSVKNEPLKAVFILVRSKEFTGKISAEITPLPPGKALSEVLKHAYCFSLHDMDQNHQLINHYLDLVQVIPVFQLLFTPKLEKLTHILALIQKTVEDN